MDASAGLHVQFGCGHVAPSGWLNFDASPTLRWERIPGLGRLYTRNAARFPDGVRYGDIVAGLPIASGSASLVYASHVLEHLALEDLRVALSNTRRYLRADGVFRLVVPDLAPLAARYVERARAEDPDAALAFLEESGLGRPVRARGFIGHLTSALGNSAHLWMWDEASLKRELERAGLRAVRRAGPDDYGHPAFAEVERADRTEGALILEGRG